MKAIIKPSKPHGKFCAPPSKSFAHRIMICAALSGGKSKISNLAESQDILATADCISALGALFEKTENGAEITGFVKNTDAAPVFPCRESGSTLRFFIPIACALFDSSVFSGSQRLIERGIGIYEDIFNNVGIKIEKNSDSIAFKGRLSAGEYAVCGNVSSQFISGLMFALPLLSGDSKITVLPPVESKPYIDITLSVLRDFGIEISETAENSYFIEGNQRYIPKDAKVEGDWSNAAPFFALNALGADIEIGGLSENSLQGDKIVTEYISALKKPHPAIDLSFCPDLAPVLFSLSAALSGGEFTGTARLKIKESDRAAAMKEELFKFGINAEISENRVIIPNRTLLPPKEPISSHNDHRIVMANAILLTLTGGVIDGIEAVNKSFPDFFEALASLGVDISYEN